jgi:DNA-binding MarR family transcriptional regulator
MEQSEIKTLRILEAFEEDPTQTQRDLAQKLKISLGMVNAFTKRLAKKGYFKISTIPRNRMQYMLTPKGLAEKTRLTYQYVIYSMQYYRDTRSTMREIFNDLTAQKKKRIFFFGVSELAEIGFITLQETNLTLAGVIDDDMAGNQFLGHRIECLQLLDDISRSDAILITKMDNPKKAYDALVAHGFADHQIVDLRTNGEQSAAKL